MGYDMYARTATGDIERDYFRLNTSGMSRARDAMCARDMVTSAPCTLKWPSEPAGEWVDREDAEPGSAWDDFHRLTDEVLIEHPNRDDPRTPLHKFSTNDGWIVTEVECRALVGIARASKVTDPTPTWWGEWLGWIEHCSTHGGFEVQ